MAGAQLAPPCAHAVIRAMFDYDADAGLLTWRARQDMDAQWNGRYAGTKAGFINGDGAMRVAINNKKYLLHRIIWFWMTGQWPPCLVDHRDLDRTNNRWSNLRLATHQQNLANSKARRYSSHGIKGVTWSKKDKRWVAQIVVDYRHIYLGGFVCIAAAACAYTVASQKAFGEFARSA